MPTWATNTHDLLMPIASLEDLAKRLRVSRRTVSRVLTGGKNVAPAVRERIEKYLARTDYVPNAQAARLAARRVPVLGLVFPTNFLNTLDDYVVRIIKGALRAAHASGHQVTLLAFDNLDVKQTLKLHRGRLVGEFVFTAFGPPDAKALRHLRSEGVPLAAVNFCAEGVDSYDCDNVRGGYLATKHLLDQGRRRIAFLHGSRWWVSSRDRHLGYTQALAEAKIELPESFVVEANYEPVAAEKTTDKWLESPKGPDAIFAANDIMMLASYRSLRRHNRRVPEDIALVGFDDSPVCSMPHLEVTFSSVYQPLEDIAQAAAERVIALNENRSSLKPETRLFPPELKVRESSGGVDPARWV
jgi:LacI family transcriptional regulator